MNNIILNINLIYFDIILKMFACDPEFKKYLNKHCVVILRKLKKNENPFNVEKYIREKIKLHEIRLEPDDENENINDENNYTLSQVKIIGTLQSISRINANETNIRTISIKPDDNIHSSHIITSDIANFALFIDTSNELKSKTLYAFSKLKDKLVKDNLYTIYQFLKYEYIQLKLD